MSSVWPPSSVATPSMIRTLHPSEKGERGERGEGLG